jgi:hypothetical protein
VSAAGLIGREQAAVGLVDEVRVAPLSAVLNADPEQVVLEGAWPASCEFLLPEAAEGLRPGGFSAFSLDREARSLASVVVGVLVAEAVGGEVACVVIGVGCGLWGAFIRPGVVLRGDRVLVDEAAEPVVHADRRR